jgi:hypothetical protein
VVIVDDADEFRGNLSGLSYETGANGTPNVMWGVRNGPSALYRLQFNGTIWTSVLDGEWPGGRGLRFPDGNGDPDAEGVARAEWTSSAIYVSTERDNDLGSTSRLSVLLFDTAAAGSALTPTQEWNLTSDLPASDPNLGLEGITWVPDGFLVGAGFFDESTSASYDPSRYANHGTGLFFVGLESNGIIYAYALDHAAGGYTRIATVDSGQSSVVELEFDRDTGALWSYCDITCHNKAAVLGIDTTGRFTVRRLYDAPTDLPDSNNEGLAIAPESTCSGGRKSVWWSDDGDYDGHSIRQCTIPCGPLW